MTVLEETQPTVAMADAVQKLFDAIAPTDRYGGKPLTLPKVGDGATYFAGSDRYPATVIRVDPYGKTIVVTIQGDDFRCRDENGKEIPDTFTPNPRGRESYFRLDKVKYKTTTYSADFKDTIVTPSEAWEWQPVFLNEKETHYVKAGFGGVRFGERRYYMDPHF